MDSEENIVILLVGETGIFLMEEKYGLAHTH